MGKFAGGRRRRQADADSGKEEDKVKGISKGKKGKGNLKGKCDKGKNQDAKDSKDTKAPCNPGDKIKDAIKKGKEIIGKMFKKDQK